MAWVLCAWFVSAVMGYGQWDQTSMEFDRLSRESGLSQITINAMEQDEQGFMWFATQAGLNRFDGYEFKVFRNQSDDAQSLPHNFVLDIQPDDKGRFWLVTFGGGLACFDPVKETCVRFPHVPSERHPMHAYRVNCLAMDHRKLLWIATTRGLVGFSTVKKTMLRPSCTVSPGPGDMGISAVFEDRNRTIWAGSVTGKLFFMEKGSQEFSPCPLPVHSAVTCMINDDRGQLLITTDGDGLLRLDPHTKSVEVLWDLPDTRLTELMLDRRKKLWVGTLRSGLYVISYPHGAQSHYRHQPLDPTSLSADRIDSLVEDRSGVVWVGTHNAGISKWSPHRRKFHSIRHVPGHENSLSQNIVRCIFQDRDGDYWFAIEGGGIDKLEAKTGRFHHFRSQPGVESLCGDDTTLVYQDSEGMMWFGTQDSGLDRYHPTTGKFEHFPVDPDNPNGLNRGGPFDMLEDYLGVLWVATRGGGLHIFDRDSMQFKRFLHDDSNPDSLVADDVCALYQDREHHLWIGAWGGGLCRLVREELSFVNFRPDPTDPSALGFGMVTSIHQDRIGRLWIGTWGGGLNQFLGDEMGFRRFRKEDGLPGDEVSAILEDDEGRLWMSTLNGVTCFNPDTMNIRNFDHYTGLQPDGYNPLVALKDENGRMWFGGPRGISYFSVEEITRNPFCPPPVLTGYRKLNIPVDDFQARSRPDGFLLKYRDTVVSFEFAALEYTLPQRNRFAYQLEGLDEAWIDLGHKREISLTRLPPGRYRLNVRAANHDDVWNESLTRLPIRVLPPPWRTWWAYVGYGLVLLVIAVAWLHRYQERFRREREYRQLLEIRVNERTADLKAMNEELLILDRIVCAVNQEVQLDMVYDTLMTQSIPLFPHATGGLILVLDEDSQRFRVQVAKPAACGEPDAGIDITTLKTRWIDCANELADGVYRIQSRDSLTGSLLRLDSPPHGLLVMTLPFDAALKGLLCLYSQDIELAFPDTDLEKAVRLRQHAISAVSRGILFAELRQTMEHLKSTQAQLLEAAHLAGMAEFSTSVIHSVGNRLNSLRVSAELIQSAMSGDRFGRALHKLSEIVVNQRHTIESRLRDDDDVRKVLDGLTFLDQHFQKWQKNWAEEFQVLFRHVENLEEIVDTQRQYADVEGMRREVNLNELIDQVLQLNLHHLESRHIQLEVNFPDLPKVHLPHVKVLRVLTNVLNNAMDAVEHQPPDMAPRITVSSSVQAGQWIEILIGDNGCGIDPKDRDAVFREGFTTRRGGRGFGLHYCGNAMVEMGGKIALYSEGQGKGATISLKFPIGNRRT